METTMQKFGRVAASLGGPGAMVVAIQLGWVAGVAFALVSTVALVANWERASRSSVGG